MVRYVSNHAAYFLFMFHSGLLAVPLVRREFESAPRSFVQTGDILTWRGMPPAFFSTKQRAKRKDTNDDDR